MTSSAATSPEFEPDVTGRGYAYKPRARAESVAGTLARRNEFRAKAAALANRLKDEHDREPLRGDLQTI